MNIKKLKKKRISKNPMLKQSLSTAVSFQSSPDDYIPYRPRFSITHTKPILYTVNSIRMIKIILVWKGAPVVTSDIVMLKLKMPFTLNDFVQKIFLPPPEFKGDRSVVRSDQTQSPVCLISRWGRTQAAKVAEDLQQASIPVKCHPIS